VRKIFGKYGEFAIGSIQTPIGQFSVKQSELDPIKKSQLWQMPRLFLHIKFPII
jgi:hypothetical protein